jgi:hypothetical protein
MRWVLLAAIQAYWRLKPPNGWRTCLFRESCSRHVYRRTVEDGLFAGLLALRLRMRRCRPGFVVLPATPLRPEPLVLLRDGSAAPLSEMAAHLTREQTP